MFGNQPPAGMCNVDGVGLQQQQQQQQQQQLQQQHAAAMGIPHYTAAVPVVAGGGYYAAQPHPAQQGQVGNPQFAAYHAAQTQQHHQQHHHQQQGSYSDPNASARYADPASSNTAINPTLALSLHDLPAPASVGSLPPVAPSEMDEPAKLMAVALQHRCEEMSVYDRNYQSIYHSSRVPGISVWDYIRRIGKYSSCSPECFVIALIILDRYSQRTRIPLSFRNVHRLSITALLVSAKLRDDIYYSNAYYASIGGVSCKELSQLELDLLSTVYWNTWVEPSQYQEYVERMRMLYGPLLPPDQ